MRERDLPGHLAESEADDGDEGGDATVFADPYAIAEALKVLKAMPAKPAIVPPQAASQPVTTH